jgi:pimeloyl-ACP methyl ester carboxylesterase
MTKPALVIHGTNDKTVPMIQGKELAESIGAAAEFVAIDGGEHHLRNVDRRKLIERIVAWLLAQDRISQ